MKHYVVQCFNKLGIIKMVAETPTEQNREMLRKLSSIESDTNGSLVNWDNLYEIINNLYSNFYSKLHTKYADMLTEKEEQVIVLLWQVSQQKKSAS